MKLQQSNIGFTLIELMVVLAVMTILLTQAIPAMTGVMASGKLATLSNSFLSNLYLARSEAIKRNARVVLCKSATGLTCAAEGGWEQGWIVFPDVNNNAALDSGEAIILREQALPSSLRLTGNAPVEDYVSYSHVGATKWTSGAFQAGTFTLCNQSLSNGKARHIIISSTGRPRIEKTTIEECL